MSLLIPRRDGIDLRPGPLDGDPAAQPAHHHEEMVAVGPLLFGSDVGQQRRPNLYGPVGKPEPAGHHADDLVIFAIQADLLMDDIGRAAKIPLPETIADYRNPRRAIAVFLRVKSAAEHWTDSERGEQIARAEGGIDALWLKTLSGVREIKRPSCCSGDLLEAGRQPLPI